METQYSFDFVHKHKLKKGKLNYSCCVCKNRNPFEECYVCADNSEECKEFCFCYTCAKCASEEEMLKIHRHLMKPTKRNLWSCDLCKECTYRSGISMCCVQCNFDCCVYCFWNLKKPRLIQ